MDPLAGLDDVEWAALQHAFGPASDVPGLLRALQSGDREALHELYGNIWHQGTTYEATAHAVPFIAALAKSDASLRPELMHLLALIADGQPYPYGTGDDPRDETRRKAEAQYSRDAREAVKHELEGLIAALGISPSDNDAAGLAPLAYSFAEEQLVQDAVYRIVSEVVLDDGNVAALMLTLVRAGRAEYVVDSVFDANLSAHIYPSVEA